MRIQLIAITLASIAASCCTPAPPELAEDDPASAAMPEIDINALGVPFASVPEADLLCAGQISPEQMDALHAAGFETFISLRVAGENGAGWEEAHDPETGYVYNRLIAPAFLEPSLRDGPGAPLGSPRGAPGGPGNPRPPQGGALEAPAPRSPKGGSLGAGLGGLGQRW